MEPVTATISLVLGHGRNMTHLRTPRLLIFARFWSSSFFHLIFSHLPLHSKSFGPFFPRPDLSALFSNPFFASTLVLGRCFPCGTSGRTGQVHDFVGQTSCLLLCGCQKSGHRFGLRHLWFLRASPSKSMSRECSGSSAKFPRLLRALGNSDSGDAETCSWGVPVGSLKVPSPWCIWAGGFAKLPTSFRGLTHVV